MKPQDFEILLEKVAKQLEAEAKAAVFKDSKSFEARARLVLVKLGGKLTRELDLDPPAQIFPDIIIGEYGIEVKFTTNDTWRSIANSVFEGSRREGVKHIYLLFGKMGGSSGVKWTKIGDGPGVKWGKYEDCVVHVRTSHVPRFEVEIGAGESLFQQMGISYEKFCALDEEGKMSFIREYARGRLKDGERLWWLEKDEDPKHTLPMQARLYTSLSQEEKRKYRAEAALLCPQVVGPRGAPNKYDDATLYMITYRGVLCHQARDLYSAGSVAGKARGGNYVERALQGIEKEMEAAAQYLDDALFIEYWGERVKPQHRIDEWLKRADVFAKTWKPSKSLFQRTGRAK